MVLCYWGKHGRGTFTAQCPEEGMRRGCLIRLLVGAVAKLCEETPPTLIIQLEWL